MPLPADDVTIRLMGPEDAADAATAAHRALSQIYPDNVSQEEEAVRRAASTARAAHLQQTDPEGCWVAEVDGQIVGTALGLIREGVWGFSLFGLLPAFQGRGIGSRLYAPALAYGAGEPGGIILSSSHPAAMRRYARSPGYRLLPTVGLSGAWDPRRVPTRLRCRTGDLHDDAGTIATASRHVRGASHGPDLPTLLALPGSTLLVVEDEGFACARHGSVRLLAARDEVAAEDLLWGAITSGGLRGGTVSYDFVTAENQWAIRAGLQAGLSLSPGGPVFVRGSVGPMAPYLPSGAYL
ncbi:MAG: GNAT family N-acetyltransferase [Actinomycetota bacterium]|nr:GNAT family N-acetyltransferase [Actinomycetota bacterium]